jgi:Type II secretion system (T2SS), protein M
MSSRDRLVVVALCLIAALVAPWLLIIQPRKQRAAKLETQITSVQGQLDTAQQRVAQGAAARSAFASSYATLVRLGEAVPTDDDTPSLIYELQAAAKATGVNFSSLTFDAGTGAASGSSSSQSASLPPGVTLGTAGFPVEPFTFTFQGSFFHLADFVGRLQRFVVTSKHRLSVSGRLMTLNAITLGAGPSGFPQITATISATTYLLPASQGLLNGATPAGPASSASQAVSSSQPKSSAAPAVISAPVIR